MRAIVQPGGSVRDDEAIAAANAAGVTMYLTGTRHFFPLRRRRRPGLGCAPCAFSGRLSSPWPPPSPPPSSPPPGVGRRRSRATSRARRSSARPTRGARSRRTSVATRGRRTCCSSWPDARQRAGRSHDGQLPGPPPQAQARTAMWIVPTMNPDGPPQGHAHERARRRPQPQLADERLDAQGQGHAHVGWQGRAQSERETKVMMRFLKRVKPETTSPRSTSRTASSARAPGPRLAPAPGHRARAPAQVAAGRSLRQGLADAHRLVPPLLRPPRHGHVRSSNRSNPSRRGRQEGEPAIMTAARVR